MISINYDLSNFLFWIRLARNLRLPKNVITDACWQAQGTASVCVGSQIFSNIHILTHKHVVIVTENTHDPAGCREPDKAPEGLSGSWSPEWFWWVLHALCWEQGIIRPQHRSRFRMFGEFQFLWNCSPKNPKNQIWYGYIEWNIL